MKDLRWSFLTFLLENASAQQSARRRRTNDNNYLHSHDRGS